MNDIHLNIDKGQDFNYLFNQTILDGTNESIFLKTSRKEAFEKFTDLGIPSKKDERYKYTSLEPSFHNKLKWMVSPEIVHFDIRHLFHCDIPTLDTFMIILLNGFYYGQKSQLSELPGGIIYGSINEAARRMPEVFSKNYNKAASKPNDGLIELNSAFFRDGFFIYVPENTVFEKPIQVVNLVLSEQDLLVQNRNLVILEENAALNLVVCDHTMSVKNSLTNSVTELFVGDRAQLDYTKVQNEHDDATQIAHLFIEQEKDSITSSNIISLYGGMIRNNHYVTLNGEGGENYSSGLFLTDKKQHIDNFVFVDHAKPHCHSDQLYKGVLDELASGAFNGRILVRQDAQLTRAYQRNNNIILTDTARMNTKPQLEIYADDVKCSHGATVGQIDEDGLFYLRSRGIPEREALLMMMFGFAHEVIGKLKIEALRTRIDELVYKRLKGELARCANCGIYSGTDTQ